MAKILPDARKMAVKAPGQQHRSVRLPNLKQFNASDKTRPTAELVKLSANDIVSLATGYGQRLGVVSR